MTKPSRTPASRAIASPKSNQRVGYTFESPATKATKNDSFGAQVKRALSHVGLAHWPCIRMPEVSAGQAQRPELTQAIAYLNARCTTLRVGLEDAMGMGHQSASMHVACRLRALGYTGRLDIVASEATQAKLTSLLQSVQAFSGAVHVLTPAQAARVPCQAGVFGGLGNWQIGNTMLNTRCCLVLQPLQWTGQRVIDGPQGHRFLKTDTYAAFRYDMIPTRDPQCVIAQHMATHPCKEVLQDLMCRVLAGQTDLMMAYGLHHVASGRSTVAGLQASLQRIGGAKRVLFLVNPYETAPGALTLADPQPISDALRAPETTLVTVTCKSLPEPLFRALFAASTLPPMLEGANTTNLMRLLGRPYLSISTRSTPFPKIRGYKEVRERCESLARMLHGGVKMEVDVLTAFIEASRRPGSPESEYFVRLRQQVLAPNADQVATGIKALHRYLEQVP